MLATYDYNPFSKEIERKHRVSITQINTEYMMSLEQAKLFQAQLESSIRACELAIEAEREMVKKEG